MYIFIFYKYTFIFTENGEIYSGVIAVIMANLVILIYIWAVFNDDEIDGAKIIQKKKQKNDDTEEEIEKDQKGTIREKENLRKRKV